MKAPRIPYLYSHLHRLNPVEVREKRKFFLLFLILCLSWTVAIGYIIYQEHSYASERGRLLSDPSEVNKTRPTPALKQPRGDYEPLRFTF